MNTNSLTALTDNEILDELEHGNILISPFDKSNLGPNSYDLTLYHSVRIINESINNNPKHNVPNTEICSLPIKLSFGDAAILRTVEIIKMPTNYFGLLSQRSNLARFPIVLNFSNLVDSGFEGYLSATIINSTRFPIVISSGIRFLQITFYKLHRSVTVSYPNRKSSKNTMQFEGVPQYKIDKEFKK